MNDMDKIRNHCKSHPGEYFAAEDLARQAGIDYTYASSRISKISKEPGFKTTTERVVHKGRTHGIYRQFKNQTSIAWIGE